MQVVGSNSAYIGLGIVVPSMIAANAYASSAKAGNAGPRDPAIMVRSMTTTGVMRVFRRPRRFIGVYSPYSAY